LVVFCSCCWLSEYSANTIDNDPYLDVEMVKLSKWKLVIL
jgi:hypothetical protein